ncbi:MAG TPA: hypothetical protein VMU11_00440 [Verrucomicrobiae bacterium]|nr:hypothetical protein [Verrucomicrobiae bacterium]
MPERPKFESLAPPSIERNEEEKFWDGEIAEYEQGLYKEFAKPKSRGEAISSIINNMRDRLPFPGVEHAYVGSKRDPHGFGYYKNIDDPELIERMEQLYKDIDEYVDKHASRDFIRVMAEQEAGVIKKDDKLLTRGEINEFLKDLYYHLRQKGYSRYEISS